MTDGTTTDTTDSTPPEPVALTPGTYLPTLSFWILVALSIAGYVAARKMNDDPAIGRIVALTGTLVCGFNLLVWFYFRSIYSKRLRRTGVLGLMSLAVLALATVRIESFSGSLIPTFKFVWDQAHDETLGHLRTTSTTVVDLASVSSTDFPQFLGPDRNGVIPDIELARDWSASPPREAWRRPVGAGWSGFSVVNGFAVTMEQRGDNELVTCYSVDDGEPQWSSSVASRHKSPLGYLGPRSTPTIHEGRVYAQGAAGILRCLDGSTGSTIWQRDLFSDMGMSQAEAEQAVAWGRANSPLVAGDKLIVAMGGPAGGKCVNIAALDLASGETLWEGADQQISYSSPILATLQGVMQVVVVNESSVSGHDLETGVQLWEHPRPGNSNMDANCSQPLVIDDSHVLLSKGYGAGAELIELVASDGEWQVNIGWNNRRALKTKFSNVSVVGEHAYALDDGVLCCVEVTTGERKWKKGRYKYGQILAVGDLLLVLGEFGKLALVDASPEGWSELASMQALEGQTWNTLCLTGKRLLIRNAEEAVCYELP